MMDATRVLIADDNTSLAETVGDILSEQGFDVVVVSTGAQALIAWREQPADLVVVDVDLPDIGGLTVARRLSSRPDGCGLVVMSARDPEALLPLCEELGARFLAKPFSPSRLLAAVRTMLEERLRRRSGAARPASRRLLGPRTPRGLLQHSRRL